METKEYKVVYVPFVQGEKGKDKLEKILNSLVKDGWIYVSHSASGRDNHNVSVILERLQDGD